MSLTHISVIILTYNEEMEIRPCLERVVGWAEYIYVVDSFSTDKTVEIARKYTSNVYQNSWLGHAKQREWAVNSLKLKTDWVFFVDADERLTEDIKNEITDLLSKDTIVENGFHVKRRFYFLNRWLKHGGYYPLHEIRMMRWREVMFLDEAGGARERYLISGQTGILKSDMLHIYNKGLIKWIEKHIKYANLEVASSFISGEALYPQIIAGIGSSTWLRAKVWNRLPRSIRPFLLFFYRYFFRFGFLDGLPGLYYCVLHDLWYPILIECLYYEKTIVQNDTNSRSKSN